MRWLLLFVPLLVLGGCQKDVREARAPATSTPSHFRV